jgi:hypothetical protein
MLNNKSYGYAKQSQEDNAQENVITKSNLLLKESERILNEALEETSVINPLVEFASISNQGGR